MKLPVHAGPGRGAARRGGARARRSLDGMPVVCCSLHSQVAPVCAGARPGLRVAYVQLAGGALPVVALGHGPRAAGARARRDGGRASAPASTATSQCVSVCVRARVGAGRGLRRRRLRDRAGHRRDRHAARPRRDRGRRGGERGARARRLARFSPPGSPKRTSASGTAASRTTPASVLDLVPGRRPRLASGE